MKVICAYMVVSIHTNPFKEINTNLNLIFSQIIPRVAVPFFFAVSGYFFIKSLKDKKNTTKKYLKRLLFTYSIWSLIYLSFQILTQSNGINLNLILKNYLIWGSWYHLWYFPALFFCILITSFFHKIKCLKFLSIFSILFYIIGLLGCSYFAIGYKISILNKLYQFSHFTLIRRILLMGLPFFLIGYFINSIDINLSKIKNSTIVKILILTILLFIIEIILVRFFKLQVSIIITLFLYPLTTLILILCLKNPLSHINNKFIKSLPNFIYYIHPLFISLLSLVFRKFLGIKIPQTPMFVIICFLTAIIGILLSKLNKNWINKLIY